MKLLQKTMGLIAIVALSNQVSARFVEIQSESEFKKEIKKPVIVKFYTEWCPGCKSIAPVYKNIAESYPDVTFLSVDVDNVEKLGRRYKITAIPRIMVLDPTSEKPQKVDTNAAGIKKAAEELKSKKKAEIPVEEKVEKVIEAPTEEMTITIDTADEYTARVVKSGKTTVIRLDPR